MSENINQVYTANPATVMSPNDLMYLGRSPYGVTDDFAILWSNILLSIAAQIQSGFVWVDVTGTSQTMSSNTGYVTDNASLVTLSLPASSVLGDGLKVIGFNSGGFSVTCAEGQSIHMGNDTTTASLSSNNQYDCVTLRCVVPDAEWIVESSQGNLTLG